MKILTAVLAVLFVLLAAPCAFAQEYLDESGFSVSLPDGEGYYYTPKSTNMSDAMLTQAKADKSTRVLYGAYDDGGALKYTMRISAEAVGENVPQTEEQLFVYAEEKRTKEAELFLYGEPQSTKMGETPAVMLSGEATDTQGYSCVAYLWQSSGQLYMLSAQWENTTPENEQSVNEIIGSVALPRPQPEQPQPELEPLQLAPTPTATTAEITPAPQPQSEYAGWVMVIIFAGLAALVFMLIYLKKTGGKHSFGAHTKKTDTAKLGRQVFYRMAKNNEYALKMQFYDCYKKALVLMSEQRYMDALRQAEKALTFAQGEKQHKKAELAAVRCLVSARQYLAATARLDTLLKSEYNFSDAETEAIRHILSVIEESKNEI